eukprot:4895043-Prymnesium_polylepis.1
MPPPPFGPGGGSAFNPTNGATQPGDNVVGVAVGCSLGGLLIGVLLGIYIGQEARCCRKRHLSELLAAGEKPEATGGSVSPERSQKCCETPRASARVTGRV